MNLTRSIKIGLCAFVLVTAQMPVQAASITYTLQRTSELNNVDDVSGRWQFDGGEVRLGSTEVGRYVQKKRVAFGPPELNKAATETTIIWKWGHHAFTLHGSHDFSSGQQVGGVSAASSGFSAYSDGTYARDGAALTITY